MRPHLLSIGILVFKLGAQQLNAQDFEVAKIQSAYYPSQRVEESAIDGTIGFIEWGAHIALPQVLPKSRGTILVHKLSYAQLKVMTQAQVQQVDVESEQYYHTALYDFGVVQRWDTNWTSVVHLVPTLASDFAAPLGGDDLLFQMSALVVHTPGKVSYGAGLAYTTRLGRQQFIPLGYVRYQNRLIELDILLPNSVSVMLTAPESRFSYGLKGGVNGGVFNNTSEIPTLNTAIDEVGYSRVLLGPAVVYKPTPSLRLTARLGAVVGRRLELIDTNDAIVDRTPMASAYIGLGLAYVLQRNRLETSLEN
ncbi:hypothetical protein GC167_09135 [bacterium]|nr:hypothetical protein [bacterium]